MTTPSLRQSDAIFDRYSNWTSWCEDTNSNDSSCCSQYAGYPTFYFEDIKEDRYDLLFEIWDVAVDSANGFEYFDEQTVLDAGISGVFAEAGWYGPL